MRDYLASNPSLALGDVAYSLVAEGASGEYRAVVVAANRDELLDGLAALAAGAPAPNAVAGTAAGVGRTVFVFPGHGTQSIELAVSLAARWQALGVRPDAVLGHSEGELAAACVAGTLSSSEAARVLEVRRAAIDTITETVANVLIWQPVGRVLALIEPWGRSLSVTARNGPSATVVAGEAAAVDGLVARCDREGLTVNKIPLCGVAHFAEHDEWCESMRSAVGELSPRAPRAEFISAVTGAGLDTSILDGDYWSANLRQQVMFEQAVRWAYGRGFRTFIECGPRPVLASGMRDVLQDYDDSCAVLTSYDDLDGSEHLRAVAEAYVNGLPIDWVALLDGLQYRTTASAARLPADDHAGR